MPTSQEVSEAQSITGSTFARAFVGAIGRGAKHLAFVPPKIDTLAEIRVHEGDLYRFMAFGRTKNTLGPLLDSPASVIIKGRPFPVSATALAPGFTRENREAQLLALDGKFSLLAQIDDGAFIAATDLIGAGGLFYAYRRSDETLYVATHLGFLLSIIGDRPEYDQTGVAAMIMARSCVGGITPLRDVFLLTAGRFLNVAVDHNGRVDFSVEVYGSLSAELAAPSESRASPETLHEQFGELLLQSMTREDYQGDTALMLTDGLDSQALALTARRHPGIRVEAATYGSGMFADLRGARRTAAALGLRHTFVECGDWDLQTHAGLIVGAGGSTMSLAVANQIEGFSRLDDRFSTAIVGYLGDALSGAHLPETRHDVAALLFKTVHHSGMSLRSRLGKDWDSVHQTVEDIQRSFDVAEDHQREMLLDLTIRQAGWISAGFDASELVREISYPFFYRELLRLFYNLPLDQLLNQSFYKEWIYRERGALAGSPLRRPIRVRSYRANSGLEFIEKSARKLARSIGLKDPIKPWPYDPVLATRRAADWLRQAIAREQEDARLRELCLDALARTLQGHYRELPIFAYGTAMILARHRRQGEPHAAGSVASAFS